MRHTINLCYFAFFALFAWLLHLRYTVARDAEEAGLLRQRLEQEE